MAEASAISEDVQLMQAVAERRDPEALARLYDLYGGLAYAIALRMVGDPDAAEEAVQEAFFNVWRNAARYTAGKGSVRTWVISIVHHQGIDRLRRLRTRQRLEKAAELTDSTGQQPDVWTEVVGNIERQRVADALRSLPVDQRRAIELAYFGGCSHSEIAALQRVPLGTVKGRLRLGIDKLRTVIIDTNLELSTD